MTLELDSFNIGDNLDLLREIKDESVDLIYMDPPYNTGRDFYYFKDKITDYRTFLKERLVECFRVCKKTANCIIHVEPRISHIVRTICDEVFGSVNFKNEIVWMTGGNAKNLKQLGRNHDSIIVYGKSKMSVFYPLYKPYDDNYKKNLKLCTIHNKYYSTSAAHNSQPEVNPRPNLTYEWNGHTLQWYMTRSKMVELHNDNRLEYNKKGIPRIKRFMEEMNGIPIRDVWDDIPNTQLKEKLKYATQKPIDLLLRILQIYTKENDLCIDPFAGSGTLGRACMKLNRKYFLIDINPDAKDVFIHSLL